MFKFIEKIPPFIDSGLGMGVKNHF
jgi:hypothetical protein